MFLRSVDITPASTVSSIVSADYRTADVFRKYDIEYCCNARWPLETVCMMKGIGVNELMNDLNKFTLTFTLPAALPFDKWNIDFIIDYITNIHHHYLKETLPALGTLLNHFAGKHIQQYPYYSAIVERFETLVFDMLPHIKQEEEVIFPYLRQVYHAYTGKDSFAKLLVRTLRKPIDRMLKDEHEMVSDMLHKFRELTDNYTVPPKACTSHYVILSKLKELDTDLVQHLYLETEVLFPRVIAMEKELLANG